MDAKVLIFVLIVCFLVIIAMTWWFLSSPTALAALARLERKEEATEREMDITGDVAAVSREICTLLSQGKQAEAKELSNHTVSVVNAIRRGHEVKLEATPCTLPSDIEDMEIYADYMSNLHGDKKSGSYEGGVDVTPGLIDKITEYVVGKVRPDLGDEVYVDWSRFRPDVSASPMPPLRGAERYGLRSGVKRAVERMLAAPDHALQLKSLSEEMAQKYCNNIIYPYAMDNYALDEGFIGAYNDSAIRALVAERRIPDPSWGVPAGLSGDALLDAVVAVNLPVAQGNVKERAMLNSIKADIQTLRQKIADMTARAPRLVPSRYSHDVETHRAALPTTDEYPSFARFKGLLRDKLHINEFKIAKAADYVWRAFVKKGKYVVNINPANAHLKAVLRDNPTLKINPPPRRGKLDGWVLDGHYAAVYQQIVPALDVALLDMYSKLTPVEQKKMYATYIADTVQELPGVAKHLTTLNDDNSPADKLDIMNKLLAIVSGAVSGANTEFKKTFRVDDTFYNEVRAIFNRGVNRWGGVNFPTELVIFAAPGLDGFARRVENEKIRKFRRARDPCFMLREMAKAVYRGDDGADGYRHAFMDAIRILTYRPGKVETDHLGANHDLDNM